jgi:general secretion pathway protein M
MKQQWLAPQEKKALKIGAWVLTPVLIYMVLWQPAHEATQKLHVSLPVLNMAEESLRSYANEIEVLRSKAKPTLLDAALLKSILEESAARNNLREAITTLDLQPPNAVRISFTAVSFDQWLKWLRVLQHEKAIRVDAMSVAKLPQAGMVKISATLINGGKQ